MKIVCNQREKSRDYFDDSILQPSEKDKDGRLLSSRRTIKELKPIYEVWMFQ